MIWSHVQHLITLIKALCTYIYVCASEAYISAYACVDVWICTTGNRLLLPDDYQPDIYETTRRCERYKKLDVVCDAYYTCA
jgi:hypothetical protein